jgi:hypothetical protein
MADVSPSTQITFLEMGENDEVVTFWGRGKGIKVISVSHEWPLVPGLNVVPEGGVTTAFYVLAFALSKGLVDLGITDQDTMDSLTPAMVSGRRITLPWDRLAGELERLRHEQDATGPLVLGILELMKTYSLLKLEGEVLGIGRRQLRVGDIMVYTVDISWWDREYLPISILYTVCNPTTLTIRSYF